MDGLTVGEAAGRTGWSPRRHRYLDELALVVPSRTASGYRVYGLHQLRQLRSLRELRRRFRIEIADVGFAARLRREPLLRHALEGWLTASGVQPHVPPSAAWVDWEQRKHERLLAA